MCYLAEPIVVLHSTRRRLCRANKVHRGLNIIRFFFFFSSFPLNSTIDFSKTRRQRGRKRYYYLHIANCGDRFSHLVDRVGGKLIERRDPNGQQLVQNRWIGVEPNDNLVDPADSVGVGSSCRR